MQMHMPVPVQKLSRGVACTFLGLTAATLMCVCANVILFNLVPSVKDANCLLWAGRCERWLQRQLLAQGAETGPTLIEAETYRFRGHSLADPDELRSKEEKEHYAVRPSPLQYNCSAYVEVETCSLLIA